MYWFQRQAERTTDRESSHALAHSPMLQGLGLDLVKARNWELNPGLPQYFSNVSNFLSLHNNHQPTKNKNWKPWPFPKFWLRVIFFFYFTLQSFDVVYVSQMTSTLFRSLDGAHWCQNTEVKHGFCNRSVVPAGSDRSSIRQWYYTATDATDHPSGLK